MSKAERTHQHILEATAPVFNTRGFEAASVSSLCEATHLTKGALYGHFRDKEELSIAAFDFAVQKVKSMVKERVSEQKTNHHKLLALMRFYAEYVFNPPVGGGCPLLNAAIEMDDERNHPLRRKVAKELKQTVMFIAHLLEEGIHAGEFKKGINSMQYAYLFFCAIEGAIMVSRVSPNDEAMKQVVGLCERILSDLKK